MKILHTADWHIGRSLYGRKRYDEFSAFLNWLAELIKKESVDALLVSGDIFDTSTPSNRAQELYYRFLCNVSASGCRHVVIIAGNHDSPSFLNAPKELLRALNVHVVGSITEKPEDEVILLSGPSDVPEAVVCAVPYLRDRDIRVVKAGESIEDKNANLIKGVQRHYADVCQAAREEQKKHGDIPIIGMGHLFTAGGKTIDGDGVRELYVGSLAHVGKDIFPDCIDYLALGHLHVPQIVGKTEHIRYAGSPIPMGYGEAKQEKSVVSIDFKSFGNPTSSLDITLHAVPCFQALERISGGMDEIIQRIDELKSKGSHAWLEIEYTGDKIAGNLREIVEEAVADTGMEIRRIKNKRVIEKIISQTCKEELLDDLDVTDVFNRLLDTCEVALDERPALIQAHQEIVTSLHEEDTNAE
ncbi:exonuclease SbcCD subunit D C-terminal domain-containing protein [Desulfobacula sp.]|uniref:exonuclease SbcCD subunit D C-terminal domain-containing protein n=1 Tax=Desulfobacula sp. TaxID=2593537 RepID=UPI0025C592A5|nr:exonuclease SbcCD subunit D C-terminal domain-containing protein [Desulfobacula sp.]MBC2706016.1 exonuclease SbcCD subunit D C-terminal domain-containing protein [Desulfobacula sp.]